MKTTIKCSLCAIALVAFAGNAIAETISVGEGVMGGNTFGSTAGFAIDFDATSVGISANWTPDLTVGQQYRIDSISCFHQENAIGKTYFLAAYSGFTGAGNLSGFLGASDSALALQTFDRHETWTFTNINLTVTPELNPGLGNDIVYFVFQTVNTGLANVASPGGGTLTNHRIDGSNGTFADDLGAILLSTGIRTDRVAEYDAVITPVPEPSTFALIGLGVFGLVLRRRR